MSKKVFDGLDELFDYKNQFVQDVITCQRIVSLLTPDEDVRRHPEKLIYTQVFPYEYIPDTVEAAKTFVCCEVDIRRVPSSTYLTPEMYVWVFTHKSNVRVDEGGVRVDMVISEISKIMNGSRMYGLGPLDLYRVQRFSPIANYTGRIMTFQTSDYNRLNPNQHYLPSNRKTG